MRITERNGHLIWGGMDCVLLAADCGTPLYVLDEAMIRERIGIIRKDFLLRHEATVAAYAGKAFLTPAMARIIDDEGLWLDVVSGGEIHTARAADFPAERMIFHGNAKPVRELEYAIESGVGRIVADGISEVERIIGISGRAARVPRILLRVSPGVDSQTHRHIMTGGIGSKFGVPIAGGELERAIKLSLESDRVSLEGLHFHLGSQIMEPDSHILAAEILVSRLGDLRRKFGYSPRELNIGGGFGVAFSPGEEAADIRDFLDPVMAIIDDYFSGIGEAGQKRPTVCIEPGRWIVSEAGITLYTVEAVKEIPGVVTYVAVDGGMTDNIRPALYGAGYSALAAGRMREPRELTATVAGRCCESSDVIARNVKLPRCIQGDIIAVLSTGAYNHSMASNYNRLPRPAVVLVSGGRADVISARETWDDLIRRERIPDRLMKSRENL